MDQPTTRAEIVDQFAYHLPPSPEVGERHGAVRAHCCELALRLTELAPRGVALEEALKKCREAMFWANAAIACDPTGPTVPSEQTDRLG
ncbi:MAG TPA: hypothetical protein VJT85_00045 [Gemmatimonadaceae bacterium]|nr:hypothetical protein [Gemmatimonadaceae bacterium]